MWLCVLSWDSSVTVPVKNPAKVVPMAALCSKLVPILPFPSSLPVHGSQTSSLSHLHSGPAGQQSLSALVALIFFLGVFCGT